MLLETIIEQYDKIPKGYDRNKFYVDKLLPITVANFKKKEKHNFSDLLEPEYMILTAGESFEPLSFSIKFFNPRNIFFLQTESSSERVNLIIELLALSDNVYTLSPHIDGINAISLYKEIEKRFIAWGRPEKLVIDFTGGTKVMSATAAMAGALLKAELVYIGSEYNKETKGPFSGSEFVERIKNPHEVFGTIKYDKALKLFTEHNYSSAKAILEELTESVISSEERLKYDLSLRLTKIYEKWDTLDFKGAAIEIEKLYSKVDQCKSLGDNTILIDKMDILSRQKDILKKLETIQDDITDNKKDSLFSVMSEKPDNFCCLIFTIYQNAIRCADQNKLDMASLLLYRTLEMISQRRLAANGLKTENVDYEKVFGADKVDDIKIKFNEYGKTVNKSWRESGLPLNIGLVYGFILLAVLKDSFYKETCKKKKNDKQFSNSVEEHIIVDKLKAIYDVSQIRNRCMITHGYTPIATEDYKRFRKVVIDSIKDFCALDDVDFTSYYKWSEFIRLV